MSGHNKWSKVKNRKGAVDAKRSKVWTKIIREITMAAKLGGEDPNGNARLRKALDDGRLANIPKDTIQRAMSRASTDTGGADYEELTYDGYGPAGVAILVECLTDNRNRTIGDVRSAFNKNGGNLGSSGSVSFMFKKKGQFVFDKSPEEGKAPSEDALLEIGLEHDIEDVINDGDSFVVLCAPEGFHALRELFVKAGYVPSRAELAQIPDSTVHIAGDHAKTLLKLIDILEDLDDVQNVWSNFEIDESEMESLMATA